MMDNQVATMDNQEEPLQRFAVHADDVRESFKLAFESVKHLTTLSAASLALFATFLDRIFPKELDIEIKVLISLSFAAFIVSLVLSAISMWRIAGLVRSRRGYEKKKRRIRWNILLPSMSYILGLSFFGTAVLFDVFFRAKNLGAAAYGRYYIYGALVLTICAVTVWIGYRVRRGNRRDTEGKYEVMYPGVSDYDELVAKEMPEQAFIQLQKQMQSKSGSTNGHETQHENGKTQMATLEVRQQAYVELLSLTHPQKLTVIGTHVSVDFFDFRDAVNKLEAQIMLVSSTEVTKKATHMVSTFVDCIVAKEGELRKEAERQDKNLGKEHVCESRKAFNKEFKRLSHARDEFVKETQKDLNQKVSRLSLVQGIFGPARSGNSG